jgi:hypothetical protein
MQRAVVATTKAGKKAHTVCQGGSTGFDVTCQTPPRTSRRASRGHATLHHLSPLITIRHHIILHHPTSLRLAFFLRCMPHPHATNALQWSCSKCNAPLRKPRRVHETCSGLLRWTCVPSGACGGYYKRRRHIHRCQHSSPDLAEALHEERAVRNENHMEVIEGKEEGGSRRITFTTCGPPTSNFQQTVC